MFNQLSKLTSSESEKGHPLTETRTSGSFFRNPWKIQSSLLTLLLSTLLLLPNVFSSSTKSSVSPSGKEIPKSGRPDPEGDRSVVGTHRKLAWLAIAWLRRPSIRNQIDYFYFSTIVVYSVNVCFC